MKKHKKLFKQRGFMGRCPYGEPCLNPLCAFGCVQ